MVAKSTKCDFDQWMKFLLRVMYMCVYIYITDMSYI